MDTLINVLIFLMDTIFALAGVCFYMLPTWFAYKQKKRNIPAIAVVNVVFGWTVIGWVGAWIWALVEKVDPLQPKFSSITGQRL